MIKKVGTYETPAAYRAHQATKVERSSVRDWLRDYDVKYRKVLADRLSDAGVAYGQSVLCLGARIGTEVKAFIDIGCFAVGLDLNPSNGTRYVLMGDFHELIYADSSVDIVFTNSFDHVLVIDRFCEEVHRVLKPNGLFILELPKGHQEGETHGEFGVTYWDTTSDVVDYFSDRGFVVKSNREYKYPDNGSQIFFGVAK